MKQQEQEEDSVSFEKDVAATILTQIEATDVGTVKIVDLQDAKVEAIGLSPLRLLGAHDFIYTKNSVQFGIKVRKDFNKVVIKLNGNDYYDVELWVVRMLDKEPYLDSRLVAEYNDVDAAELGHLLVREAIHTDG